MSPIKSWFQTVFSRRGFLFLAGSWFHGILSGSAAWAKAEYARVNEFQIRSIESTQKVDLKTWRLKIEGLVEKPISLSFDEITKLPRKVQVKSFICVEGWGLDDRRWEGVHLKELFSKVKIGSQAKFITFHATGSKYKDSLSIQEALETDTLLAYKVDGKDLPPRMDFPFDSSSRGCMPTRAPNGLRKSSLQKPRKSGTGSREAIRQMGPFRD